VDTNKNRTACRSQDYRKCYDDHQTTLIPKAQLMPWNWSTDNKNLQNFSSHNIIQAAKSKGSKQI
jgi:hypothetical protein